jgi:hypothetical protein
MTEGPPWTARRDSAFESVFAKWTFSPRIEIASGRPHNLFTGNDRTFVNSGETARPNVVPLGTPGSFPSPDERFGLALPPVGSIGNLGRNVYRTSTFSSVDFRLTRKIPFRSRVSLNVSMDVFNLFNRVNTKNADTAFTRSGDPVSAFNPRQVQFALRINF